MKAWKGVQTHTCLLLTGVVFFLNMASEPLPAQRSHKEFLTFEEIDKIREAQNINDRVPLYLEFAGARLQAAMRLAGIPTNEKPLPPGKQEKKVEERPPAESKQEPPKSLPDHLGEYVDIYDELLRHLEQRLNQAEDVRKALKAILKDSPRHQASLKSIASKLGEEAPDQLATALTDTASALEGARKALAEQEDLFKKEKTRGKEKHRE